MHIFNVVGKRRSRVKEIIFAQVGGYFTHYLLEDGRILYRGYTQFKKLSGNRYPWRLAIGDLVEYVPVEVWDMFGKNKVRPAISV